MKEEYSVNRAIKKEQEEASLLIQAIDASIADNAKVAELVLQEGQQKNSEEDEKIISQKILNAYFNESEDFCRISCADNIQPDIFLQKIVIFIAKFFDKKDMPILRQHNNSLYIDNKDLTVLRKKIKCDEEKVTKLPYFSFFESVNLSQAKQINSLIENNNRKTSQIEEIRFQKISELKESSAGFIDKISSLEKDIEHLSSDRQSQILYDAKLNSLKIECNSITEQLNGISNFRGQMFVVAVKNISENQKKVADKINNLADKLDRVLMKKLSESIMSLTSRIAQLEGKEVLQSSYVDKNKLQLIEENQMLILKYEELQKVKDLLISQIRQKKQECQDLSSQLDSYANSHKKGCL